MLVVGSSAISQSVCRMFVLAGNSNIGPPRTKSGGILNSFLGSASIAGSIVDGSLLKQELEI